MRHSADGSKKQVQSVSVYIFKKKGEGGSHTSSLTPHLEALEQKEESHSKGVDGKLKAESIKIRMSKQKYYKE